MAKKTIYYSDPVNDDFAATSLKPKPLPPDYPFAVTNPLWRIAEFILYRVIALPIIWLIARVGYGLRIRNRRALRKLRGKGFYLYGNHTQGMMDAYTPALICFPKYAHVAVGPQAVSSPALGLPVRLLGGIPVPDSVKGLRAFMKALSLRVGQKRVVTVYPEAHIWPWYTGIRPFSDACFTYPVRDGAPVAAFVTTYRKRRVFKDLPPRLTVTLSEPFYPNPELDPARARRQLRDAVYGFMCREAARPDNYAYYEYVRRDGEEDPAPQTAVG